MVTMDSLTGTRLAALDPKTPAAAHLATARCAQRTTGRGPDVYDAA
jgi:hypothetical protein